MGKGVRGKGEGRGEKKKKGESVTGREGRRECEREGRKEERERERERERETNTHTIITSCSSHACGKITSVNAFSIPTSAYVQYDTVTVHISICLSFTPHPTTSSFRQAPPTLTHSLSLLFLFVEDGEFELCPHVSFVCHSSDEYEVEREVVTTVFI